MRDRESKTPTWVETWKCFNKSVLSKRRIHGNTRGLSQNKSSSRTILPIGLSTTPQSTHIEMQRSDSFPDVKQMEVVEFISPRRGDWKERRFKEWNSCQIVSQTIFSPLFFSPSLTKRVLSPSLAPWLALSLTHVKPMLCHASLNCVRREIPPF